MAHPLLNRLNEALDGLVALNRRAALEPPPPSPQHWEEAARAVIDAREALAQHLAAPPPGEAPLLSHDLAALDQRGAALAGLLVAANPYRRASGRSGWWWTARSGCPAALLSLDPEAAPPAELVLHARSCGDCAKDLRRARALAALAPPPQARPASRRPYLAWALGGAIASASAAALLVGVLAPPAPGLLEKGEAPSLTVYATRAGRSVRVEPGRRLFLDDALRLRAAGTDGSRLLVLIVHEQAGLLWSAQAASGAGALEVPQGRLGAAAGGVRVVALWSPQPVAEAVVLDALRSGRSPPGRVVVAPYTLEAP